jgi:hypothetical protein
MIFGSIDLAASVLSYDKERFFSNSTLYGIISPGMFSVIHFLIFPRNLFFLFKKSYSERLIKYTTGLHVRSL